MAVKKVPTLEQLADIVVGHGRTLERLGRYDREVREAAARANAGVESLAKRFGAVYDALVASGVVTGPTPAGQSQRPSAAPPAPAADEQAAGAASPTPAPAAGPGPSWLAVGSWEEAEALMGVLVPWLGQVYLRYPDAALPSCWAWHPAAVEELWWLCRAWCDAYAVEEPSSQRAGDWHDRQRPAVVRRLYEDADFRRCRLANHADTTAHAHPNIPGVATLPHVTTAWASPERAAWPLSPTPAQLHQDQHQQPDLSRRHRSA